MKKILLLCFILVPFWAQADLPFNLSRIKQRLQQYHDSGAYQQDTLNVVNRAQMYLRNRLIDNQKLKTPRKLAVVFDIDETLLSNYSKMRASNFGAGGPLTNNDPVITPTATLFHFAQRHHVAIFLITGRRQSRHNRQLTMENLKSVGLRRWQSLYLKPKTDHHRSAVWFKSSTRRRIERMGYDIVFSMGDQLSDLVGGAADMTYKLPNPFYWVP